MKIVTAEEMRAIDRTTSEHFGVPSLTLMENAGKAVAKHVRTRYGKGHIAVVCGKGNNGGDGFVAARLLHEAGRKVEVVLLAEPAELRGDAAVMYGRLPIPATVVKSAKEWRSQRVQTALQASVYIDAILGTGFKPPVSGLYAEAIKLLYTKLLVVAVDIPSGADADAMGPQQGTIAHASSIVTFTAPRPAHLFSSLTAGPTYVADIGSPDEAVTSSLHLNVITARDYARLIGDRPADSNKGNYGHVLIVGGSVGKAGSVAMAGKAALRAGAGLASVATAKSALPTVAGFYPELMTEPLPETRAGTISAAAAASLDEIAKGKSVLAIGPGISRHAETSELVRSLVSSSEIPVVLDADGLNAFEGVTEELNGRGRVLVITPHPGEMARLAGCTTAEVQSDRLGLARRFAREHGVIVVLKGNRTLVVEAGGESWVNTSGNPGMATGGTGDILTGMVAAMIAQHANDVLTAVCAAVHLHGLAGDVMREKVGEHSMVATDLLRGIPGAFHHAQRTAVAKYVRWEG